MVKVFILTIGSTVCFMLQPWHVLFVFLAAWVNREQAAVIEFYQVELESVLKAQGKKRRTTWKTIIKAHWDVLSAIDFTTVEVWTKGGLVTYYLLVKDPISIELKLRPSCLTGRPLKNGSLVIPGSPVELVTIDADSEVRIAIEKV